MDLCQYLYHLCTDISISLIRGDIFRDLSCDPKGWRSVVMDCSMIRAVISLQLEWNPKFLFVLTGFFTIIFRETKVLAQKCLTHGFCQVWSDTCRVCGNSCPSDCEPTKREPTLRQPEMSYIIRVVTANDSKNDWIKDKAVHSEDRNPTPIGCSLI